MRESERERERNGPGLENESLKRGNPVGETMSRFSFSPTATFHTTAHTKVSEAISFIM